MCLSKMKPLMILAFAVGAMFACSATGHAVEVRQIMNEPRYSRGDENVRIVQPADTASWIWMPGHEVYGVSAYADKHVRAARAGTEPGFFFRFRNDFASDGSALRFDVTADERFVLLLDGEVIARGPQRGDVNHWYYQSYEVRGLTNGYHRLEAVCQQLLSAAPNAQLSYRGGFLLKAEDDYDVKLTTGKGKWLVAPLKGTVMTDRGSSDTLGAGNQCRVTGTGIVREEPPSRTWKEPAVIRSGIDGTRWWERQPGWMLFPADRPDQIYDVKTPGRVVNVEQDISRPFTVPAQAELDLWWDLGDYYCAYPELETSGGKGAAIIWGWAESLYDTKGKKGNRNEWTGKSFSHVLADTFVSDGRDNAVFTSPWWRCGRWCRVTVKTADSPLTIKRIAIGETRYPLVVDASFQCDDLSIGAVLGICRRTVESCMHEIMFDCPYYEQQMYAGDTRIQLQILNTLTADLRMARFAMSIFDWNRRDNGMIPMQFPSRALQESSTYTMCWIMMFGDHLLWHDDLGFLRQRMPGVRHALAGLAAYENADGLLENLPGWSFMDWVKEWAKKNPDFPTGCAPCAGHGKRAGALDNLLYLRAIQSAASVDKALGEAEHVAFWKRKEERLAKTLLDRFWSEERGLIADTVAKDSFSEHAQALGIVSGLLTGSRRDSALRALVANKDLAKVSSYFAYYLFEALAQCGRADVILDRLHCWKDFVSWGARTAFETQYSDSRSDCHAWSASPIYFLQSAVAGIRPVSPCYGRVRVEPQPGKLKWIRSVAPTPKGKVAVDLKFRDGGAYGSIVLPPGLEGDFIWQGVVRPIKPGMNEFPDPAFADVPRAALPLSYVGMQHVLGLAPDWWEKRHEAKLSELASYHGKIDLVMFGDSITHDWEGARGPGSDWGGRPLAELRKTYSVVDFGYGGDTTRNVLWRMENGELDGYEAKCVMLLVGTNNGLEDTPEDVAAGIRAILNVIARKQPKAKTILVPILLRGADANDAFRVRNERANEIIRTYVDDEHVLWCDFRGSFVNDDGTPNFRFMREDRLHLIASGYDVWAEALKPILVRIIGR